MFGRTFGLLCACAVLAVAVAPACGGSADDPGTAANGGRGGGSAGSGGRTPTGRAGGSAQLPVPCGSKTCTGVTIPIQDFAVPACCANERTGECGLDSSVLSAFGPSFVESCQPLAQPGTADDHCPASAKTPVEGTQFEIQFPGCCRTNHTCGYQLDSIGGAFRIGLGCVDATPFLDGGSPQTCGAAGAPGAGGDSGAGAGGDSNALAGASGTPSAP